MHRTKLALLASTALTVASLSGAAVAQDTQSCQGLLDRVEALPQELPEDVDWTIEDVRAAEDSGDAERCAVILADVERMSGQGAQDGATDSDQATAQAEAEAEDADQMRAVEQAQTRVTLQDEAVVEGTVFIDRERANVEVSEGQTEVMITPGQPNVNVTEQAAQITVREQPARVTVEMAQPTIRIEQPAPEIIITMPEPGVDVANAEPQVEVRQAEPMVTVTQASPSVDLELQVSENPEESAGIEVEDRDTGERFAMGESREMPSEDGNVSITRGEPIVRMQRSQDDDAPQVNIARAQPTINYERAEPEVVFSQQGEPSVQFAAAGEPTVTLRRSGEDGSDSAQASAEGSGTEAGLTADETESELAEVENEIEQTEEAIETAAGEAGQELESAAEETGQEIETAAEETGQDIAEETRELASDAEAAVEGDETRLTEDTAAMDRDAGDASGNTMADREGMTRIAAADLTMDALDGAALFGANDERIGEISEAVLADDGLRVTGAVVEVGGFLGLGEHHVMLDLDEITFFRSDAGDDVEAYVSMTQEDLEGMPEWQDR